MTSKSAEAFVFRSVDRNILVRRLIVLSVAATLSMSAGCVQYTEIPQTQSAIEQQLLVRALERALAELDAAHLKRQTVSVQVSTLAERDNTFVEKLIRARLREAGLRIVENGDEAEQEVHVFAHVLGTKRGGTLVGLPSLPTPFVNVGTPEIALFKHSANRGHGEVQIFVFDRDSGRLAGKTPIGVGKSKYDNYTILLFVKFTVEDIEVKPPGQLEHNGSNAS